MLETYICTQADAPGTQLKGTRMNLFQYLDIKYQETAIELGRDYSVAKDGRAKAIHFIINTHKMTAKWLAVPGLLLGFILVKLKLKPIPISPIKAAAEKEAAELKNKQNSLTITEGGDQGRVVPEAS